VKDFVQHYRSAFADGDMVATRWTGRGTHDVVRRAEVARFEDDLAAYFDSPEGRSKVREAECGREPEGRDQTDEERTET
jgi:hypothetical protein